MSRSVYKTVSNNVVEFTPKAMREDPALSADAQNIEDRPLVAGVRKMTREERLNLQGILENKVVGENTVTTNIGTALRFIWKTCVIYVKNVLLDKEKLDEVRGAQKDALFDTEGIEGEISEIIQFIQEISSLNEQEAKT